MSAATNALKLGAAALPLLGPANTTFAFAVAAPVPPRAIAKVPDVILLASKFGISAATSVSQAGTAPAEPVPVILKNFLVAVVLAPTTVIALSPLPSNIPY